jgi:hypothetical protein
MAIMGLTPALLVSVVSAEHVVMKEHGVSGRDSDEAWQRLRLFGSATVVLMCGMIILICARGVLKIFTLVPSRQQERLLSSENICAPETGVGYYLNKQVSYGTHEESAFIGKSADAAHESADKTAGANKIAKERPSATDGSKQYPYPYTKPVDEPKANIDEPKGPRVKNLTSKFEDLARKTSLLRAAQKQLTSSLSQPEVVRRITQEPALRRAATEPTKPEQGKVQPDCEKDHSIANAAAVRYVGELLGGIRRKQRGASQCQ